MNQASAIVRSKPSVSRTLIRIGLICLGTVAILLPAWLPNQPGIPIERGTVELLQAGMLGLAAAVMFGAAAHAGRNRSVCRVLGLALVAAVIGELEDFFSGILGWNFPEGPVIGLILLWALVHGLTHKAALVRFLGTVGTHAGSGLIASALLIIYVFNRVIGSSGFWRAALGTGFDPEIPRICRSYLELLACYLIFIGTLGYAITLARRPDPA